MSQIKSTNADCRRPLESPPDIVSQVVESPNYKESTSAPSCSPGSADTKTRNLAVGSLVTAVASCVICVVALSLTVPMNKQIQKLRTDLSQHGSELWLLQLKTDQSNANLNPTSPGPFATVQSSCGTFFVSLQNAQPYLNGVKITLHIGNPMMCSYNGATLTLKYGGSFDQNRIGEAGYWDSYQRSLQTKVVRITDQLQPGRWNSVDIILAPLEPSQFGTLQVGIQNESLSLMK